MILKFKNDKPTSTVPKERRSSPYVKDGSVKKKRSVTTPNYHTSRTVLYYLAFA